MAMWNVRRGCCASLRLAVLSLLLLGAGIIFEHPASADTAAFDLSGPRVEMTVSRGGKSLPIADVPNLQPGDQLWIHPDFPDQQSARYLLIVAFLQGSTNPPPENWFIKAETWNRQVREEGIRVTVPNGAQQPLIFLAPETGGDFSSLRSAVRGKPGAFVRASQDLNAASLERSRLDKYLDEVRATSTMDPSALKERSALLARTLGIKVNEDCFDKPAEQQASCLMDNSDQLVLDDGHTESMAAALTSGPSSDLIGTLSTTPLAGGGSFSPYVGAVVDMVRIFGNIHSPEYQYIPALALPKKDELMLKLNNPPSFRKPMSVLVVALPAVQAAQMPPLRPVSTDQVFCLGQTSLVLPVEGAPLVFSTEAAHEFVLHLQTKAGQSVDLPATADAAKGGFLIDTKTLSTDNLDSSVTGTLQGLWGFDKFNGPSFHLENPHSAKWQVPAADQSALIVGRTDTLHLQSECAVCAEKVSVTDQAGKDLKATWKIAKPNEIEVEVPLTDESAGSIRMNVKQFGLADPDVVPLQAYSEAAHLDSFTIHAGDGQGVLVGTRLDEVKSVEISGVRFVPAALTREDQEDQLQLSAANAALVASLQAEQKTTADVNLKDGRDLNLQTTVEPPRPKVTLVSKSVQPGPTPSAVHLANQDELPQAGRMSFFLKSVVPDKFVRSEKIEVATEDDSFHVMLSIADGNLMLQDSETMLAVLDPLKSFGASAFGPLRFRPIDEDRKGDWQPLGNLVRVPTLKQIRCPDSPDQNCTLSGTNLFLIDSVASDAQFTHTVPVPVGFAGDSLMVPRPNGTLLYIKLRDDPATVDTAILPVIPDEQP